MLQRLIEAVYRDCMEYALIEMPKGPHEIFNAELIESLDDSDVSWAVAEHLETRMTRARLTMQYEDHTDAAEELTRFLLSEYSSTLVDQ